MGTDIDMSITLSGMTFTEKRLTKLPDWSLYAGGFGSPGNGWDYYEGGTWTRPDGTEVVTEGVYQVAGQSRYDTACAIVEWAQKYTAKHPEATVTFSQEWWEGEPGQSFDVYRSGERVREESKVNAMVPLDLGDMLEAARKALATTDPGAKHDALTALVGGLS